MNFKHIILSALILTGFSQCQKQKDTSFLITKDSIGKLNKKTLASDLKTLFIADSIIQDTTNVAINTSDNKVRIYEKGGKHLLTLTPNNDSLPTIESIRIFDPRFITESGVGLNSTFKDIKDNYSIQKILTSLNNVVVLIKDNPFYFTIDKKELPANLRFGTTSIEAVQIPNEAKIKYMMATWE